MNTQRIIVTGGCGFIGGALVRQLVSAGHQVLNIDALTYAAQPHVLDNLTHHPHYHFLQADITDAAAMHQAIHTFKPSVIFHLAAESHVDNSITNSAAFIQTNIIGTHILLEATRSYLKTVLNPQDFRFMHISTDEVYGDLPTPTAPAFTETTPYAPNSPYSASKAASDHLARAWQHTYGVPIIITHCSNNYGPHQHPEKLIPHIIHCALAGKSLPVYGNGENIRDWIHVEDHCDGLIAAWQKGQVGETYNFGGNHELTNIALVKQICQILDTHAPRQNKQSYAKQISFVTDRPGHDLRYAINNTKSTQALDWQPQIAFNSGLEHVIEWYIHEGNHTRGRQRYAA